MERRGGIILTTLEEYYNKFNEEKRLNSRHGQVEFQVSMKYIHDFVKPGDSILDLGAGTGRYSLPLFEEGFHVTAVELVQHNLGRIKQKNPALPAFKGNALNLKRFKDNTFDAVIMFGPMYHLQGQEKKLKALSEAKRVVKPQGLIFIAYITNEYGLITYGFKEKHILDIQKEGRIDESFHLKPKEDELYSFLRLSDINQLNEKAGLERVKILSPDGPANYMRPFLNQLSEEEFEQFIAYQMTACEREELLGAGAHLVDIVMAKK